MLFRPLLSPVLVPKWPTVHWDSIVIVLFEFSCKGIIENEQFFDSQIARIGFYWQKQVSKHHKWPSFQPLLTFWATTTGHQGLKLGYDHVSGDAKRSGNNRGNNLL